jgi:putative ABC transport system ATP-binding protein
LCQPVCRLRLCTGAPRAAAGRPTLATVNLPTERPAVLVAEHLGKHYQTGDQDILALQDVNLRIGAGEFIVLLGPSGSGKSTLLNILGGLDRPSSGHARFAEHELSGADDATLTRYRREHVGFVFQFYNLMPSLTVRENVQLVTDLVPGAMRAEQALALVGLSERLDHFPAQLSGGEQQRVAIARAIVKRPQLLLCDEPTGALDYATGKQVLEVIETINRELGTTTVVITHNAAIAGMADRVIHLAGGRILREERPAHKLRPHELSW